MLNAIKSALLNTAVFTLQMAITFLAAGVMCFALLATLHAVLEGTMATTSLAVASIAVASALWLVADSFNSLDI